MLPLIAYQRLTQERHLRPAPFGLPLHHPPHKMSQPRLQLPPPPYASHVARRPDHRRAPLHQSTTSHPLPHAAWPREQPLLNQHHPHPYQPGRRARGRRCSMAMWCLAAQSKRLCGRRARGRRCTMTTWCLEAQSKRLCGRLARGRRCSTRMHMTAHYRRLRPWKPPLRLHLQLTGPPPPESAGGVGQGQWWLPAGPLLPQLLPIQQMPSRIPPSQMLMPPQMPQPTPDPSVSDSASKRTTETPCRSRI